MKNRINFFPAGGRKSQISLSKTRIKMTSLFSMKNFGIYVIYELRHLIKIRIFIVLDSLKQLMKYLMLLFIELSK